MMGMPTSHANWRATPFIRILILFIAGILVITHYRFYFNPIHFSAFQLLLVILLIISSRLRIYTYNLFTGVLVSIIFFTLGISSILFDDPFLQGNFYGKYVSGQKQHISIRVIDIEKKQKWIKVIGEVINIEDSVQVQKKVNGKLLIYLEPNMTLPAFGQVVKLYGKVQKIPEPKNPHSFNYKIYCENQNILFQLFCRVGEWKTSQVYYCNLNVIAKNCRQKLIELLKEDLGDTEEYKVGSALVFGYRDEVPEELNDAYIQTGSIHILAVSGLHVGLISGLISLLLSFIRLNNTLIRFLKLFLILISLWFFVLIAGASGSLIRAAVMFTFLHTGVLILHRKNIYNILAASAFVILLFEPKMLYDVGFQLSYAAVISIISIQPLLKKIWKPASPIWSNIWELTTITISAQVGTLPLILYYFHQFSLYFLISGILVVPISSLAMYSAIVLYISELCLPFISFIFSKIMFGCLFLMNSIIYKIQKLPGNLIDNIPMSLLEAIFLALFIYLILYAIIKRNKQYFLISFGPLLIFLIGKSYLDIKTEGQNEVILYNSNQCINIDYILGSGVYHISERKSKREDKFTSREYRVFLRTKKIEEYVYPDLINSPKIIFHNFNLTSSKYQLFFLEKKSMLFYGICNPGNVYVLNDVSPGYFTCSINLKNVFLNPQMPYNLNKEWVAWAKDKHINVVDLKKGAYILKL